MNNIFSDAFIKELHSKFIELASKDFLSHDEFSILRSSLELLFDVRFYDYFDDYQIYIHFASATPFNDIPSAYHYTPGRGFDNWVTRDFSFKEYVKIYNTWSRYGHEE